MTNETNSARNQPPPTTSRSSTAIKHSLRSMIPWALALAMVWVTPVAASAATGSWVQHRTPNPGFTIDLPQRPKVTRRTTPTFVGDVKTKVFVADSPAGQFTVSHSRLPGLATVFATDGMLYDGARDKLIEEHGGGKVISERSWPGLFERDVSYELRDTDGTLVAVGRMLVGNSDGEVIVLNGVVIPGKTADLDRFFDSLHVIHPNRS